MPNPQLSLVRAGLSKVLCVNLLLCKSVGCGGPKLTGGASGQGVFWETLGPGPLVGKKKRKKKKRKTHITNVFPP